MDNNTQTEGDATNENNGLKSPKRDRLALLYEAIDDLKKVQWNIEKEQKNEAEKQQSPAAGSSKNRSSGLKKQCKRSLERLQKEIHRQERRKRKASHRELQSQQKRDVLRLLISRNQNGKVLPGEAFFLLEWNWWVTWCRFVNFFDNTEIGAKKGTEFDKSAGTDQLSERTRRLLSYLPTGATFPSSFREDPGDNVEDDDSLSDSSDDEDSLPMVVPGPIDNSKLLLDSDNGFFHQWYNIDSCSLRPNLIRGYHYEILPREVYCALRTWYSETTPSICRRISANGTVNLYPVKANKLDIFDPNKSRCSSCRAPGAKLRCGKCRTVQYCDRSCQQSHWYFHRGNCKRCEVAPQEVLPQINLPSEGGLVGLNNLGNTCFMNSALQSLSHATPLTRHFLSDRFKLDLNKKNPLGTGGKLAIAYETFLKDIWMKQGNTAISPIALKRAIALFAPRFANYQQHDAQEFLAYLLDGLHEDVNRIRRAPYVEMPDVTDGQNMTIAAAEAWNAHKKRNDSMVMDTFYGQFQSTCVCPKCNRVSVSFDAFNHVSLEIPSSRPALTTMSFPVLVHFSDGNRKPIQYGVKVRRQGFVLDLKNAISKLSQVAPERLVLTDVYENSIFKLLEENVRLSTINPKEVTIVAYEVTPYSVEDTVHIIVTHSLASGENGINRMEGSENGETIDQNAANTNDVGGKLIGLPFMTSIGAKNSTCRDLWELMRGYTQRMVAKDNGNDLEDASNVSKLDDSMDTTKDYRLDDVLTVRIVDNQGQPRSIFENNNGDGTTNVLPHESEDLLSKVLGEDCAEAFLFLKLVWKQPKQDGDDSNIVLNPDRFLDFDRHPTFADAMREQQASTNQGNNGNGVTLNQCFQSFSRPERLDTDNMWYCSKCQEHVQALKTMKLWRLPNILVVHLKRFEYKNALRRDKLGTFVDFPLAGLDMNPHCANFQGSNASFVDNSVPADYDLFAVVNHYGRLGFGHYTAFAMQWDETGISKKWNTFDDSTVRPVSPSQIVSPAAYILFYRRRTFH